MTLSPDALHLLEVTEFLVFFRFLFFPSFHWQLGIAENILGDMKTVVGLGLCVIKKSRHSELICCLLDWFPCECGCVVQTRTIRFA